MLLVQKHQIKVGFGVVMFVYPLLVPVYLPIEQPLPVSGPEIHQRMSIRQHRAKIQSRNQVSFDSDVTIEVRFTDTLLVHRSERRHAPTVVNHNSKLHDSAADARTRAVQIQLKCDVRGDAGAQRLEHLPESRGRIEVTYTRGCTYFKTLHCNCLLSDFTPLC